MAERLRSQKQTRTNTRTSTYEYTPKRRQWNGCGMFGERGWHASQVRIGDDGVSLSYLLALFTRLGLALPVFLKLLSQSRTASSLLAPAMSCLLWRRKEGTRREQEKKEERKVLRTQYTSRQTCKGRGKRQKARRCRIKIASQ